ncbi:GNAT family N-acetyltransferase [Nocardia sp. NPDC051570]|uniref:GNAT family N-acetyltransferase n=1 Tax=Nocardia sp. NPDC051570 TaxID=3364324 RepID=UPI00379B9622
MSPSDARAVLSWRYESPYQIYDMGEDSTEELLDPRSPYYAVHDQRGNLVGFFSFGTAALPWDTAGPALLGDDGEVAIGLGMRPDATGGGAGLAFVRAGLDFARTAFQPAYFRLFVFSWNQRGIRVYQRAGFHRVGTYIPPKSEAGNEFWEMRRDI